MTKPATWTLNTCLTAAIGIALAGGTAIALDTPAGQPSKQSAAPASTLNATQHRTMARSFAWLDRDSGLLNATITPRTIFVEYPGSMEFNGRMAAKVKDPSDMTIQIATDEALALDGSTSVVRGAIGDGSLNMGQRVQARMTEARDRLAPSLIEGFMDVDVHTFWLPQGVSEEQMAEILMQTGDYEYVEPDWLCYPTATVPNDPSYNSQWWHKTNRIDSESAWDHTTGSSDIIIAVCDTGVDLDHPDLVAGIVSGFNSDTNLAQVDGGDVSDYFGHGSMVAGCAAAQGNNSIGVAGVGWNFQIMPIRITSAVDGTASLSNILQGARWASDEGAYVANCSYGGSSSSQANTTGNQIRVEGHLLVFSSGNDGIFSQPNDWQNVTIVGASNQTDVVASFSEFGPGVDVVAPGTNILTTNRFGGYSTTQGTSFSSPITAGALALIHAANPALSADDVEQYLFNTCKDLGSIGEDDNSGWGRINVGDAVFDAVFGPSVLSLPYTDSFNSTTLSTSWKNPVGTIEVNDLADNEPSDPFSMNLDATDAIETIDLRAGILTSVPGEISFSVQHKGVESGETLLAEYRNVIGVWNDIVTIVSDGNDESVFAHYRFEVPGLAQHDTLRIRFTAQGSDSSDNWFIDDVLVAEAQINTVPWNDNFESGINTVFDWSTSEAIESPDATNAPAGPQTAELNGSSTMVSHIVDASDTELDLYIRAYTQHKGVESGETLLAEYRNVLGVWLDLETITSDGSDQNNFDLNQWSLPAIGYSDSLQIRFTTDGDEADDRWFIDDVAITTEFIEDLGCPADFTGEGSLDIFDVLAFLDAFNAGDASADFTGEGDFNIFDVLGFLDAFNAGCP